MTNAEEEHDEGYYLNDERRALLYDQRDRDQKTKEKKKEKEKQEDDAN